MKTKSDFSAYLRGYFQVVIAAILFGSIGLFVKLIDNMPSGSIIFYRLLFGLSAISIYLVISGRLGEIKLRGKKAYLILLGLFQAGAMISYFVAIKYTALSVAVLLLYTAPIHVTLLSPLVLKESIHLRGALALGISIGGVILVNQSYLALHDISKSGIWGLVIGLAAGFLYACMFITSRYLRNEYSGVAQASWATIITMLIFAPYVVVVSPEVVFDNIYLLILFGLLPTALGAILHLGGLRHVRAQDASVISLLEPVATVSFAFLLLDERMSLTSLLGGGLILSAAIVVSFRKRNR